MGLNAQRYSVLHTVRCTNWANRAVVYSLSYIINVVYLLLYKHLFCHFSDSRARGVILNLIALRHTEKRKMTTPRVIIITRTSSRLKKYSAFVVLYESLLAVKLFCHAGRRGWFFNMHQSYFHDQNRENIIYDFIINLLIYNTNFKKLVNRFNRY